MGEGKNLIDMIYVENAAEAHLQAARALSPDSSAGGKAYFISQGEPVNCWDWINQILALACLPPVRRSISQRAAWRLGVAMEAAYTALMLTGEPPMTRFLAAQLSTSHYFDTSRAAREFGFAARISTEEGMSRLSRALQEVRSGP